FDTKESPWKGTINRLGFGGVHVLLKEGSGSNIAKEYNVRALPQTYLIDKDGNFAPSPLDNKTETLKTTLEGML
ncbi:MAG: TlpA family protein disulfide reductase, partial [Saprospiraceae bacterium]